MLNRLLSHDLPRSRWLRAARWSSIVLGLALAPFLFPGSKALNVAAKMLVFIVLVASFDLLLGYTGIVSFAHTMFFGIGAYGVAIASTRLGPGWGAVALGLRGGAARSRCVLSLVIGLFSLRVKAIFFAMITLAVAAAFQTLASQLSRLHRRRGRPHLQEPEAAEPALRAVRERRSSALTIDGSSSPTTCCSSRRCCCSWRCCASSTRRSAACCRRSARTTSAPRRSAIAPWSTARCRNVLVGAVRHAGRRAAGAVAALHRARHHAVASRSCSTSC